MRINFAPEANILCSICKEVLVNEKGVGSTIRSQKRVRNRSRKPRTS